MFLKNPSFYYEYTTVCACLLIQSQSSTGAILTLQITKSYVSKNDIARHRNCIPTLHDKTRLARDMKFSDAIAFAPVFYPPF